MISRLHEAGIEHAFTVCGGGSIFLNDALGKGPMRYVCTHHEQAAAIAAVAYARARNGLGLCVVTSGPGGTNAITGCADAFQDSVPVVFLSGQVFSGQTIDRTPGLRTLGVQEINIVDMVKPITKYAAMVRHPEMVHQHLKVALGLARTGRPGPVWLDIPADVQNAQVPPGKLADYEPEPHTSVDMQGQAEHLLRLLKAARKPLLHIGQGIRLSGAEDDLHRVLARLRVPVVTARNGNDLLCEDHALYVGRPGTFSQRGANFAVQSCDLYLAIGTRLSLAQTGYNAKDYARQAKVVQVDIDGAELDKDTVRLEMAIQADAGEFLRALLGLLRGNPGLPDWGNWLAHCHNLHLRYPPGGTWIIREGQTVYSYHLIDELSRQCGPDDIIVTDVGTGYQHAQAAWKIKEGQRLLSSNGLAPMGWGLPAAIGAAIGTGRRVICITGDGGLMMNLQELATVAHHRLPVKIFVLNNGGYLTMRQSQAHAFDGYMGSDEDSGLSFPCFGTVAAANRLDYLKLYDPLALRGQVAAALVRDDPVFCEVMMDRDQPTIPKSINKRLADGTIQQTPLEDMWPHLPAEEIAEALKA